MQEAIAVKIKFTKELSGLFEKSEIKTFKNIARAIDQVGNKTKTVVKRVTAQQAGVKVGKVGAVLTSSTTMGQGGAIVRGQYEIICRDVTLSLKEFTPRSDAHGVFAWPWGKRKYFPHAFFGPGGHVFERVSKLGTRRGPRPTHSQLPFHKLWGPAIPNEMVKDNAEQAFYRTASELLGPAIERQMMRAFAGEQLRAR